MKISILLVFTMCLLVQIVSAIESTSDRVFRVNEVSGTTLVDASNNQDGFVSSASIWEPNGGMIGGALFPNATYNGNFTNNCVGKSYTLNFWYKANTTDGSTISNPIFTTENNPAPGSNPRFIRFDDFTTFRYSLDAGNVWLGIPSVLRENYTMFTIRRNLTPTDTLELLVNTTSQGVRTNSVMDLPTPFSIGGRTDSLAYARLDIIRVVCEAVNNSVISDWWNNGAGTEAITNSIPITKNVSITPEPLNEGNTAKGHANYTDADGDVAGGNQTYWYVNKTIINEANNSFTLLGGNVTLNSNITFSARYNETQDWSN